MANIETIFRFGRPPRSFSTPGSADQKQERNENEREFEEMNADCWGKIAGFMACLYASDVRG